MHVTIRKYAGCGDLKEIDRVAQAVLVPVMRTIAGFHSYTVVDTGHGTGLSIGMFDSKASADNANLQARAVVQGSALKDLLPNAPETIMGEMLSESSLTNSSP